MLDFKIILKRAGLPEIRKFARSQQKLFYNLLFRVSAAATQKLAQDPRFIGGQAGLIGELYTWGRTLTYHPHVHYLVPAGGVDEDGNWVPASQSHIQDFPGQVPQGIAKDTLL